MFLKRVKRVQKITMVWRELPKKPNAPRRSSALSPPWRGGEEEPPCSVPISDMSDTHRSAERNAESHASRV